VRTVIPPQFTDEDLQRLLTVALSAPVADQAPATATAAPATAPATADAIAPVDLTPLEILDTGDAWDEKW
jgi:hypothetical protein